MNDAAPVTKADIDGLSQGMRDLVVQVAEMGKRLDGVQTEITALHLEMSKSLGAIETALEKARGDLIGEIGDARVGLTEHVGAVDTRAGKVEGQLIWIGRMAFASLMLLVGLLIKLILFPS